MKNIKLFCFGFGQVAKQFVKKLIDEKYNLDLVVTNTEETKKIVFKNKKFSSFFFKSKSFDNQLIKELETSNIILVSIPPIDKDDVVINFLEKNIRNLKATWITYLSATSVFGDKKGKWVDEDTELNPTSENGKSRLLAEQKWIELSKKKSFPIQIFRLSGIYSQENNILKRIQNNSFRIINKPDHFFSRIHVDDIANILSLSINKFKSGEIYNLSDDYPCSNEEIAIYASELMKIKKPNKIEVKDIENEMMKSFYKDSKKVSNKKVKSIFSYKFKFPTYKEGLNNILNHLL